MITPTEEEAKDKIASSPLGALLGEEKETPLVTLDGMTQNAS